MISSDGHLREALDAVVCYALARPSSSNEEILNDLEVLGFTSGTASEYRQQLDRYHLESRSGLRRRHELAALAESSRAIAEQVNLDDLWDVVVASAHRMGFSDVTYLSEFDPADSSLRVRATRGTSTDGFSRIVVKPGTGIASLVAVERRAWSTVDYFEDRTFVHDPSLEGPVAKEGVVSMAGVPLISHDRVLGVLFIGRRTQYVFDAEEVATLRSLADFATTAIWRVIAYAEQDETRQEMSRRLVSWESFFHEWTESSQRMNRAFELLYRRVEPIEVLNECGKILGAQLTLLDDKGAVITSTYSSPPDYAPRIANRAKRLERAVCHSVLDGELQEDGSVVALSAPSFGTVTLWITEAEFSGQVFSATAVRAAQLCLLSLVVEQSRLHNDVTRQSEIFQGLIAGSVSSQQFEQFLRHHGITVDQSVVASVVRGDSAELKDVQRRAATLSAVVVVFYGDELLVLSSQQSFSTLRAVLDKEPYSTVRGVYRIYSAIPYRADTLRAVFRELFQATKVIPVVFGPMQTWVDIAGLAPLLELFDREKAQLQELVQRVLGPVLGLSSVSTGESLIDTMRAYIDAGQQASNAAKKLYIHPNTMTQRLQRIDGLLPGWRDPDQIFLTIVALYAHSIMRASTTEQ
ncbi:helix-turn-helix domain-containing protein [Auritidibacter ignavus]|uniref:helix-turn-helix domain-containing protein n=1 Tax=Auritidibacter ignavus TaxID=678932 RepID=UPI002FE5D02E